MRRLASALLALCAFFFALGANALSFGYYLSGTTGSPAGAITAAGHTPTQLTGLSAADLAGIDVLWILNGDNGNPNATVLNPANQAAIAAFVNGGGVLSFHDRAVTNAATYLPGAGGITFTRELASDIDVLVSNTVTNGPAGVIGNTTLDGGNFSNHGFAVAGSLPGGGVGVLSTDLASELVDFYYAFGLGFVYYSTIPLDFYLSGAGNNPPRDAVVNIYAVNEAAFQAQLARGIAVPEPGVLLLLGVATIAAGVARRGRSR